MRAATVILMIATATSVLSAADDYERLAPDVWSLRITNPADRRLCVRAYFNPNRPPWYGDTIYVGRGRASDEQPERSQWLGPGESSPWVDIGPHMSKRPLFGGSPNYLSTVFLGAMSEPERPNLRLQVEVARGSEHRVVRTVLVSEPNPTLIGCRTWLGTPPKLPTLGLMIPVDPERSERVWTLEEAARQQLEWIDSFGPRPQQPRYIWFISHQSRVSFDDPSDLERMQAAIVRNLGYNNLTYYASDADGIDAIRRPGIQPLPAKMIHKTDDYAARARELREAGTWRYHRLLNCGDEISLSLEASPEQQDAAFIDYLRSSGFKPMDFVRPEDEEAAEQVPREDRWQFVHLGGPLPPEKPRLLFEAAYFRYVLWGRELKRHTEQFLAHFPPGSQSGSNFSPHLSVWPDVRKWINLFRDGALTMPWSEDWWWQVPEASPQAYGFLLDALRHAADYHGAPTCFYTIPDPIPGMTPAQRGADLLRMNYFALGHQVKVVDHFAIYHQAFGTCDYIDFELSRHEFRAIHRILTEVSRIDERLYRARMRPAEVAILLSVANDVWNTEDLLTQDPPKTNLYWATTNLENHERKALHLALRHSHVPVDLITDEDVAAGMLDRYRVLYLVGPEIHDSAVPKLIEWVRSGGVLIAEGGAGLLNQYREPIPSMHELFGIADADLARPVRSLGPSRDLPDMQPLDRVRMTAPAGWSHMQIPAYACRATFAPVEGTEIIGRFAEGAPAATMVRYGPRGKAICLGAYCGLAYLQPAMAAREGRELPEQFPADLRDFIVRPTEWAGAFYHRPIIADDPLIDATLQEGPLGPVITLVNFRNAPQQAVTLTLHGLPDANTVTSGRHGDLQIRRDGGVPVVTVPVDRGDFLLVD
ncbi:MAG: hypothetical protein U9R79_11245 [Armatimonadota bacterium]|nr:hypothetical protein [Armatimonadota bacterium]